MDTVSFQTNVFPMLLPKHSSKGFYWCAGVSNFFIGAPLKYLLLLEDIHIDQVLKYFHVKWNQRLPVSMAVKIISRTETHSLQLQKRESWIPSCQTEEKTESVSVCLMNNVIIAESCWFINPIQLSLYFYSEGPKWNQKLCFVIKAKK